MSRGDHPRRTGPTRRRVLAYGSAAIVTTVTAGTVESEPANGRSATVRGRMHPYQYIPDARCRVLERNLDWLPGPIDEAYRTHVLSHEHAPSLRVRYFTDERLPATRSLELERSGGDGSSPPTNRTDTPGTNPVDVAVVSENPR